MTWDHTQPWLQSGLAGNARVPPRPAFCCTAHLRWSGPGWGCSLASRLSLSGEYMSTRGNLHPFDGGRNKRGDQQKHLWKIRPPRQAAIRQTVIRAEGRDAVDAAVDCFASP